MEKIQVVITNEDFINGEKFADTRNCPFATAVKRAAPGTDVQVGTELVVINGQCYIAKPPFECTDYERCKELVEKGEQVAVHITLT